MILSSNPDLEKIHNQADDKGNLVPIFILLPAAAALSPGFLPRQFEWTHRLG
jgi:hypothetical protein